jgi:CO/xanthine dehydrogenase Mo-binding subunit
MDIQPFKAIIADAYFSAIGIRITEIPITPQRIVKGLYSKERSKTEE